jgi:hypothetical protein
MDPAWALLTNNETLSSDGGIGQHQALFATTPGPASTFRQSACQFCQFEEAQNAFTLEHIAIPPGVPDAPMQASLTQSAEKLAAQ